MASEQSAAKRTKYEAGMHLLVSPVTDQADQVNREQAGNS
jgi:hypothetical protein